MKTDLFKGAFLAAALMALNPAPAAQAQGDLAIRPGDAWTHGHSGIAVPSTLGGNPLTKAKSYAPDELDVGLSFEPEGAKDYVSFYIFRNTNGGVPVWFSQAQWAIENRSQFGEPARAGPVQSFVPPGQDAATGLKAVYEPKGDAGFSSTGVALLPVGGWYVKLRVTSRNRTPAQLAEFIDEVLAEIRWPQKVAAAAALPVVPCPKPLAFGKKSKDVTGGGMAEILSGALMSAAAGDDSIEKTDAAAPAPVQWCRDTQLDGNLAVYRRAEASDSYLLAYGDNGNGVWAGPSSTNAIMAEIEKKKVATRYGVTLHTAGQDINFVSQDRLPSPERTIEIVNANRRASSVTTWGKERKVEINSSIK
jgi:hypothetical protein